MPLRVIRVRYPYEIYLLCLCVITSLPSALGYAKGPNSIESQLPPWQVKIWTFSLLLGSITALVGIMWSQRNAKSQVTALLIEQLGLIVCGFAGLIYATSIILSIGMGGLVPFGMVLGFSLASFAQAWMIHTALDRALALRAVVQQGDDR